MSIEPVVLADFLYVPAHVVARDIAVVAGVHTVQFPSDFVRHFCLPLAGTDPGCPSQVRANSQDMNGAQNLAPVE